jgi:hypothetical protein
MPLLILKYDEFVQSGGVKNVVVPQVCLGCCGENQPFQNK